MPEPAAEAAPTARWRSSLLAYGCPATGIFLGLWLFWLLAGRSKLFQDAGTFWHTVVGEQLLTSRQLIYTDTFSFTFAGRPWIPHQWLGECLMALVHRLDGLDSLLLATATLLAGLYTWVAQRFLRAGLHWSLAVLLVVVVLAASTSHFHVRPHLGTIVFLGLAMGLLVDFEAGRIGLKHLAWLVPLYWLWSNIHGGTLGGLATLALALAGWSLYHLRGWKSPLTDRKQLLGCCVLGIGCGLVIFLNPYGSLLVRTWLAIMESQTLTQIIVEHRPLRLTTADGLAVLPLVLLYVAALATVYPQRPRVVWLLPLVWLYLACTRVRHAPLFAITAAVALADMLPYTAPASWLARSGSDLFQPLLPSKGERRSWRPALVPVVLVAVALVLQLLRLEVPVLGHRWVRLDAAYWPIELLDDLARLQNAQPGGTPIFNEYLYGGFLIYHTPGYRVFVDDRCELYRDPADQYPDQWLAEFVRAEQQGTAEKIREWERRYGRFGFALVRTRIGDGDVGFDDYFRQSPEWQVIKRTATATFYRRNE